MKMRRFRANYKRPKLIHRLLRKWLFISFFLFSIFPNHDLTIVFKSSQKPTPNDAPEEFLLHVNSEVTLSPLQTNSEVTLSPLQTNSKVATPDEHSPSIFTNKSVTKSFSRSESKVILPPPMFLLRDSEVLPSEPGPGNSSDSHSPTSCQGRCGDRLSFPCSCTDICVVNGNCCLDMREWCFHMQNSARSRFKHLKDAKVECSSKTYTFMVMSCPGDSVEQGKDRTSLVKEDMASGVKTRESSTLIVASLAIASSDGHNSTDTYLSQPTESNLSALGVDINTNPASSAFLTIVLDTPATDRSTGLVYRNKAVAQCNGVLDSNILSWIVQIAVTVLDSDPVDLEGLYNTISPNHVGYSLPDSSQTFSKGSECIVTSQNQCKKEWLIDRPDLESLCLNGGITYYKTRSPLPQQFFDNIHCLICNVGSRNYSRPVSESSPGERNFKLSLLASLSSDGAINIKAASGKQFFKWKTLQCSATTEVGQVGRCNKTECGDSFEKRPDGICRILRLIRFAFSGGDCAFKKSNEIEMALLSFLECYMKTYENAEFDTEKAKFETVFDEDRNLMLLQVSSFVYYPSFSLPSLSSRAQIIKSLMTYVSNINFCCDPSPSISVCSDGTCRLGDETISVTKTVGLSANYNSSLVACMDVIYVTTGWREDFPLKCLQESANASKDLLDSQAPNVSCIGENVRRYTTGRQRRHLCSTSPDRSTELWLAVSAVAMVSINL